MNYMFKSIPAYLQAPGNRLGLSAVMESAIEGFLVPVLPVGNPVLDDGCLTQFISKSLYPLSAGSESVLNWLTVPHFPLSKSKLGEPSSVLVIITHANGVLAFG